MKYLFEQVCVCVRPPELRLQYSWCQISENLASAQKYFKGVFTPATFGPL